MVHIQEENLMSNYDRGLIGNLKIDLKDYERGVSGASKCENVQISKKQYIRMAELAIKQFEWENR